MQTRFPLADLASALKSRTLVTVLFLAQATPSNGYTEIVLSGSPQASAYNQLYIVIGLAVLVLVLWWWIRSRNRR